MYKRPFDIFFAILGLLFCLPFFVLIAVAIAIDSKGGVFYKQQRVGIHGRPFKLFKFRTMSTGSDKKGLITVGAKDSRVTKVGYYLRKYKLDELPQLLNVLLGDMSFVGPRPEVQQYVDLYTNEQLKVLQVKPGITDYASIAYSNENEILGKSANPQETYIQEIMPAKLRLNLKYIEDMSLITDIKVILNTIFKISNID